ncbi:MAG TPA: VOC family protein, partial [Actinotalea sp.]|nr:VOC family protein [Actinotalea sp.]
DDARSANDAAVAGGANPVAPPTRTPWDSLNARLDAPGGVHLTLFQELGTSADQDEAPGPGDAP